MPLRIESARVICPANSLDQVMDVLVENGRISRVEPPGKASGRSGDALETLDARGLVLTPGLVDMHVHLREPGEEYKETIETGARAAAAGGFTSICCMPNTRPVNDNRSITEFILARAREKACVRVFPIAAITSGLHGNNLSEFADLKDAGAVAVSDDGLPVRDPGLMRRALEYAKSFDLPVASHCEEPGLAGKGVMNEGPRATAMGLAGIPNEAESIMVRRDIALAGLTGARLHICHVSARESVEAIRQAKTRGIAVTAETAPHYFSLTDQAVSGYNTFAKMNPPLRSEADVEAVRQGLADGTLDAIASDHAPHADLEKDVEFDLAKNGITGLETSLALSLALVHDKRISLSRLVELMSLRPAGILGLEPEKGIAPGAPADLTLMDPDMEWTVDREMSFSKSGNTPFHGWKLKGRAVTTIVRGLIVHDIR